MFRITPSGSFTNLYFFVGPPTDGAAPNALVQGSDGSFYGTAENGGTNNHGTVFRITPSGSYTSLYFFVGSPTDGSGPQPGLVQGSDGNFYGTTYGDNAHTVFRLSVSLNPPANQVSAIQLVGINIVFSIPSVAGETYQLQFTADLTSGIWSNVPGASVSNSIGSLLTLTNFVDTSQQQGFYRFAITP